MHETRVETAAPRIPKLRIAGVHKRYPVAKGNDVVALDGIDLDVARGEFISIVGPSGCGKSTLLRLVADLDRPSQGFIEIQHESASRVASSVVFQEYSIFPWKTVENNVAFGLRMQGRSKRESLQIARDWLKRVGLDGFEKSLPSTLSGGMKQRVAVARALALDPEVLLLDEPFAALDAQIREVMQEELLGQWQDAGVGRSAVLVTHSLDEAVLLGDRVVLLSGRPGRVRAIFDVPFERPRTPALRGTKEFAELRDEIWSLLREEVIASSETPESGGS